MQRIILIKKKIIKLKNMKKSLLIIAAFLLGTVIFAQTSPIDALFDKYSDEE